MQQRTSIDAYNNIKPELKGRRKVVYDEIEKLGNATNTEIATSLGVPINQITGRTNELVKMGLVAEGGKRMCRITGKNCIYWEIVKNTLF